MNNEDIRQHAKNKVEAKIRFGIHLVVYLAVMTLLIFINLNASTEYLWFIWPLMGWGIAVVIHALSLFSSQRSGIKERMIEREMMKANNEDNY